MARLVMHGGTIMDVRGTIDDVSARLEDAADGVAAFDGMGGESLSVRTDQVEEVITDNPVEQGRA